MNEKAMHHGFLLLSELEAAGKIPSKSKFRLMPCQVTLVPVFMVRLIAEPSQTFIMCGCCPYFEKCVFLHDQRVRVQSSHRSVVLCRATPQSNTVKDAFYWPDMSLLKVMEKRDRHQLPTANQEYHFNLVSGNRPSAKVTMHDIAVYSMWEHFVHYMEKGLDEMTSLTSDDAMNTFTGLPRLPVLVEISQRSDAMERMAFATFDNSFVLKSPPSPSPLHDMTNKVDLNEEYKYFADF